MTDMPEIIATIDWKPYSTVWLDPDNMTVILDGVKFTGLRGYSSTRDVRTVHCLGLWGHCDHKGPGVHNFYGSDLVELKLEFCNGVQFTVRTTKINLAEKP